MKHACKKPLDDAGIHAMTCPIGGRMCQRHDAIRNWLAEECRDRCGLAVRLEVPRAHAPVLPAAGGSPPGAASMPGVVLSGPPPGGTPPAAASPGRMDLVITLNGDDIPVDVSVASVLTVNAFEITRRT
eukprot:8904587-Prorocentrum_lima.AAC.1